MCNLSFLQGLHRIHTFSLELGDFTLYAGVGHNISWMLCILFIYRFRFLFHKCFLLFISLVTSVFFLLEGHQSFIYLLLCIYIIFSIMIFSLPFLTHFVIILSWYSKLLTLFAAETILLAASEVVLGETAVSSLEARSYFPD